MPEAPLANPGRLDRMPAASDVVLRERLEAGARDHPDRIYAVFPSGEAPWTWADALAEVRRTAALLASLGVGQGDMVAVWLPNGKAALRAWFAINYLGAVYVPLNGAYRGRILEHALALAGASVMFAHPQLAERLGDIETGVLNTLIFEDAAPSAIPNGLKAVSRAAAPDAAPPAPARPIQPWDPQAIIFTSGTTGPSKGVLVSYVQFYASAVSHPFPMSADDRGFVHSPLFHVSGIVPVMRGLFCGGSVAVAENFSASGFWRDVKATGATFSTLMGSMATLIGAAPPSEDERTTPLQILLISPLTKEARSLATRANVACYTVFSMSEAAMPIHTGLDPEKTAICGRVRHGIQARIVDEHDVEVAPGAMGELILRADLPWTLTVGYHKDPAATARLWRNGWFHTGDGFRVDADGDYLFVDRLKDSIRRRGENISSYEVESEVMAFETVGDCAAVAVPSPMGDDEVLVAVEPKAGATVDPEALFRFLQPRLPHFMLPRYLRVLAELPRTPTHKIQKAVLRDQGLADGTWDREAAGFRITREKLSRT